MLKKRQKAQKRHSCEGRNPVLNKIMLKYNKINIIFFSILILIFSSPFVLTREKPGSKREKMMLNKAKLPDDYLVICRVGNVGVILHYDTGLGTADITAPGWEYPINSGNSYLYAGNFWYQYKDANGEIRRVPSGNLNYIADCAGVSGIMSASATDSDAPEWALSALDTRSDWYDKCDNNNNPYGSDIWATVITHAWSEEYRDDFILWEITFENKGTSIIKDLYFGKRMDCDISSLESGNGERGFWRDDMTAFYQGTDKYLSVDNEYIYISYMFDSNNPNIPGDDTGGWKTPKESPAFFGTITISSPPTKDGYFSENQPSAHVWWDWDSDPSSLEEIYNVLSWGHNNPEDPYRRQPPSPHEYRYLAAWGPYDILPGESITIRIATGLGNAPQEYFDIRDHPLDIGIQGLEKNLKWAKRLYFGWVGPKPPATPNLSYTFKDNAVHLEWDNIAEVSIDPLTATADFEGYKLWKSTDNVRWELLLQCDIINDIGMNTGITHSYMDYSVASGYNYFYAVTAYDRGNPDFGVGPLESSRTANRIHITASKGAHDDLSRISVAPNPYYASAAWNPLPSSYSPSEDKIGFFGLPEWANIYIYTLSGTNVDKIEHRDPNSGVAYWDGLSKKMYSVVSGVYIYVVEDKNGNKVRGKFVFVR